MSPGQCGQMALPDQGKGGCQGGFVSRVHPDSYVGFDRNNPKPLTLNSSAVRIPESVPGCTWQTEKGPQNKKHPQLSTLLRVSGPIRLQVNLQMRGTAKEAGGVSPEGSARPGRPCPSSNLHVCRRYRDDEKRSIGQDDDDDDDEDEDEDDDKEEMRMTMTMTVIHEDLGGPGLVVPWIAWWVPFQVAWPRALAATRSQSKEPTGVPAAFGSGTVVTLSLYFGMIE